MNVDERDFSLTTAPHQKRPRNLQLLSPLALGATNEPPLLHYDGTIPFRQTAH